MKLQLIKRNCYTYEDVEKFEFTYLVQLETYLKERKQKTLFNRMKIAYSHIIHKELSKASFSCDRYHDYVLREKPTEY